MRQSLKRIKFCTLKKKEFTYYIKAQKTKKKLYNCVKTELILVNTSVIKNCTVMKQ